MTRNLLTVLPKLLKHGIYPRGDPAGCSEGLTISEHSFAGPPAPHAAVHRSRSEIDQSPI